MKNTKKKLAGIWLAAVLMLLAGCSLSGDKDAVKNSTDTEKTTESTAETEPATEPETEPFTPVTVNIKMIGDMLMHGGVTYQGQLSDGSFKFDFLFEDIKSDIQAADLALVNQEVILGGSELGISGYPCFNTVYELGDSLVNTGFNVILHATNHALDMGTTGIDNCLNFWKTKHPDTAVLGINATEEDTENIYVYEKDGLKIAILNYTYGTNGIALPEGREYIVNVLDYDRVVSDLKKAREMADFVIVCPHWGVEYSYEPYDDPESDMDQVNWAQVFADNGADLIIGTHPHVIESVEWIEAADGRQTLCYYSLGNYVSHQDKAPRMLGAMADVTIESAQDGSVYIKDYGVTPLVTHKAEGTQADRVYKLSNYTQELAAKNTIVYQDSSFSLEFCKNLCRQVFGDLYEE